MSKAGSSSNPVWTLGHSSHPWAKFLKLLEDAGIGCVIDVRSRPYSRYPHFSKPVFLARLNLEGICYEHVPELGGIRKGDSPTIYEKVAQTPEFRAGIERLLRTSSRSRTAIVCAEHDPLQCHRFLLVSRVLALGGIPMGHILRDGTIEPQWQTELRLLRLTKLDKEDLLASVEQRLEQAYRKQERRVTDTGKRQ